MNSRFIIDAFWMADLFVGVAALALLSSTRCFNGRLPANASGDVVYLFGAAGSLALVL